MSIRNKLIILLLFPALAFLFYAGTSFQDAQERTSENAAIATYSELATHMSAFVHECQKERGMTAGFIGSMGAKFVTDLPAQRNLSDERFGTLQAFIQENPLDLLPAEITDSVTKALALAANLDSIRKQVSALDIHAKDAIGYYTTMNGTFLNAVGAISHQSSDDILARELAAYTNFLKSKERAGIERAVLTNTFSKDAFGPGMYAKEITLIGAQNNYMDAFLANCSQEAKVPYTEALADPSFEKVEEYRSIALSNADTGGFGQSAEDWFKTSTTRINKLKGVEDALSEIIVSRAQSIKSHAFSATLFIGVSGITILGLTALGGFIVIRSITKPINEIVQIMDNVSHGDLTAVLKEGRKDELGTIAVSSNRMVDALSVVIRDVISASHDVASAATEVSANAEELSQGMYEQSSNLNQVSAAVEEMNASINEVAAKSSHAESLASDSGQQAESGGEVVGHTITGIEGIDSLVNQSAKTVGDLGEKSQQIGAIIDTINDIADQTNLLALNAAIEAARAGEHGRGFAVVADEVRKLAERTTEATSEVSQSVIEIQNETQSAVNSINSCQEEMATGVSFAKEAGESLKSIVQANASVNSQISGIAAATEEQSDACNSISQNIENISSLIERSTDGVREAATASSMLSSSAEELQSMVARFKVE